MSSLKEFQCEICGIVTDNPIHWFVIECGDQKLAVIKWDLTAANSPTARHFCGEAHAQVYISRWFESICAPTQTHLQGLLDRFNRSQGFHARVGRTLLSAAFD